MALTGYEIPLTGYDIGVTVYKMPVTNYEIAVTGEKRSVLAMKLFGNSKFYRVIEDDKHYSLA